MFIGYDGPRYDIDCADLLITYWANHGTNKIYRSLIPAKEDNYFLCLTYWTPCGMQATVKFRALTEAQVLEKLSGAKFSWEYA
jgi:hypothetical protein